jgi:hypothetical protein
MFLDKQLLEVEIDFWQEMIDLRQATATPDCLERMQQALALAEIKMRKNGFEGKWRTDA